MIKPPLINVVIPAYNEGTTIIEVVKVLKKVKDISKIIVVDDGSNKSSKKIYSSLTGITLLTHTKNKGKLSAMHTGLHATDSKYVFFIDADLLNLSINHIAQPIEILKTNKYVAIMLTFGEDPDMYKTTGFSAMHTGQRILKREFLLDHQDRIFSGNGWAIEANITKELLKHKKEILVCELDAVTHIAKEDKYDFKQALFKKSQMTIHLLIRHKAVGYLIDYIKFRPYLKNIEYISA